MGSLRLVDLDGTQLLDMPGEPGDPLLVTTFDPGYPDIREDVEDAVDADGTVDTTAYVGARGVSIEATARNLAALASLQALTHPGRRYYLHAAASGWGAERRILVRSAGVTAPLGGGGATIDVQAQWKAPVGLWEDAAASSAVIMPVGANEGGIATPVALPKAMTPGAPPGQIALVNAGAVAAPPIIDIYGPCTSPVVSVDQPAGQMSFPGLTVPSGVFLRIDVNAKTATYNGDPAQSKFASRDFTSWAWWTLPPGLAHVTFNATNPGTGCRAVVTWRGRYL